MRIVFRCDPAIEKELPRPVPARSALPDWLRTMPRTAFSELHGQEVRTVKQCPPFVDAMSHGFIIPLPCDVTVHDGVLSWDWDHPALTVEAHPRSPVSFHVPAQVAGTPFFDPEVAIVKFNSFWTIELEPGYSLFATHPVNRADLPFRRIPRPGGLQGVEAGVAFALLCGVGAGAGALWSWLEAPVPGKRYSRALLWIAILMCVAARRWAPQSSLLGNQSPLSLLPGEDLVALAIENAHADGLRRPLYICRGDDCRRRVGDLNLFLRQIHWPLIERSANKLDPERPRLFRDDLRRFAD